MIWWIKEQEQEFKNWYTNEHLKLNQKHNILNHSGYMWIKSDCNVLWLEHKQHQSSHKILDLPTLVKLIHHADTQLWSVYLSNKTDIRHQQQVYKNYCRENIQPCLEMSIIFPFGFWMTLCLDIFCKWQVVVHPESNILDLESNPLPRSSSFDSIDLNSKPW